MTSLLRSKVYNNFTHSQVYKPYLQQPLELVLKSIVKENDNMEEQMEFVQKKNFEPLLIFDPIEKKERPSNESDGIFYHLCKKPNIADDRKRNLVRPSTIRLLICLTMYSESREEYEKSIHGIHSNLKEFKDKLSICNEDIAVCVIMDGIQKIDHSMRELFRDKDSLLELPFEKTLDFREKVFSNEEKNEDWEKFPKNSVYMYQTCVEPERDYEEDDNYLNVFLCCKLQNAGKLSSHLWFFRGFCEMFNPKYCALIDCGTKPKQNAYVELFKALESDSQIGGACGYMGLNPEPIIDEFGVRCDQDTYAELDFLSRFLMNFFDIQKAQVFEYAFGHILDKSFESFFGFIHVLPGAFSIYRWDALRTKITDERNILDKEYLKTVIDPNYTKSELFSVESANMYLAEDRILCLEIFSRENFILKYIPEAICWTDPAKSLTILMNQRRRWINGSWFALYYVLTACWGRILGSKHSFCRKTGFYITILYSIANLIFSYFMVGFYYIFLHMVCFEFLAQYNFYGDKSNTFASLAGFAIYFYIMLVGGLFYYSLVYKSKEAIRKFQFISSLLGLFLLLSFGYMVYVMIIIIFFDKDMAILNKRIKFVEKLEELEFSYNAERYNILILYRPNELKTLVITNLLCYVIPVLLNPSKSMYDILFSTIDYLFYSPCYFHTLIIYAFCNIDDLSWGTKGLDASNETDEKAKKYKASYVYKWLVLNMMLAYVVSIMNTDPIFKNYFLLIFGYFFTMLLAFKTVLSIIYHFKYYIFERIYYYFKMKEKIPEYAVNSKLMKKYIDTKIKVVGNNNFMNKNNIKTNGIGRKLDSIRE